MSRPPCSGVSQTTEPRIGNAPASATAGESRFIRSRNHAHRPRRKAQKPPPGMLGHAAASVIIVLARPVCDLRWLAW